MNAVYLRACTLSVDLRESGVFLELHVVMQVVIKIAFQVRNRTRHFLCDVLVQAAVEGDVDELRATGRPPCLRADREWETWSRRVARDFPSSPPPPPLARAPGQIGERFRLHKLRSQPRRIVTGVPRTARNLLKRVGRLQFPRMHAQQFDGREDILADTSIRPSIGIDEKSVQPEAACLESVVGVGQIKFVVDVTGRSIRRRRARAWT